MKRTALVLLAVGVVLSAAARAYLRQVEPAVEVRTAPLTRGSIVDTVSASGTLQAVTTVQVGTQVSGTVAWLGADFNSIVRRGQVIAKLDPSLLQAQVEQARANVVKAEADYERSQVALADAEQKLVRARQLDAQQLVPKSELDAAQVTVNAGRAQLQSSAAQVTQAQASLNQTRVTLEHAVITAPIDGIVIQRAVDVGQTVAASLQSPTIFSIAADLTRMELNASIDESDIGRIAQGQRVTFTVDAYPNEQFSGVVQQVRLQPTVVQNVTTYSTIISAPNPELKLKPGMTASLKIEIARRDDVLRVPAGALRFKPTAEMFEALVQKAPALSERASPSRVEGPAPGGRAASSRVEGRVWLFVSGQLKPVAVRTGISDGVNTEAIEPNLQPGTEVVIGVSGLETTSSVPAASGNPLMGPQRPARR